MKPSDSSIVVCSSKSCISTERRQIFSLQSREPVASVRRRSSPVINSHKQRTSFEWPRNAPRYTKSSFSRDIIFLSKY
ncbi:hypothetical protein T4B_14396 [Trichinella pseudospiralis]|uniref:Uncharacterized protein n=2 Tax=Trichinella pseudospiralis TaxID=6337 RepID=A0A0V1K6B1_TRIPS|nr:hypothetical protein T4A_9594 [Trichinella pseudospiralis]KRY92757.1 hypothetical protein T4D_5655 [Trichinella pseudospiralis]KRZ33906.1 hypothetical protein T4B_14396 [Trichinella pseudospiralis]KRZ42783.1 hypothetical protein T4C_10236 [Trichinella pseudospiralis]